MRFCIYLLSCDRCNSNGNLCTLNDVVSSQARVSITNYFKQLVEKRKEQGSTRNDVLGVLLEAQADPQVRKEVKDLDIDFIAAQILLLWFAAYETTANTLIWILKFLFDNPEVFKRVQVRPRHCKEKNYQC
jgi:cytochrome P450